MDDAEVFTVFTEQGARRAFGPTLHIEGDYLFFDGYWPAALRASLSTFAIRADEPPRKADALKRVDEELADRLAARGLVEVGADYPLVAAITYVDIALQPVPWIVWSLDGATAAADLSEKAGGDKFLGDYSGEPEEVDFSAELGGGRRLSGLPASLILTVGIDQGTVEAMTAALADCRFVSRALDSVTADACRSLLPTMIVVDATERAGKELIIELQVPGGRLVPVVAVTDETVVPAGADLAFSATSADATWVERIHALLP